MRCGIYLITNLTNQKIYIGSSNYIQHRWLSHKSLLRRQKHPNPHFQSAWNKYGEQSFELQVLEECQSEDLITIEQYYLDWLEPFEERGYNIAKDAKAPSLGKSHTKEARNKISTSSKGRFFSKKTRKKMSISAKEKWKTKDYREKYSKSHKGIQTKGMFGKQHTKETKEKMSVAHMGKPSPLKGKPISKERREKLFETWIQRKANQLTTPEEKILDNAI